MQASKAGRPARYACQQVWQQVNKAGRQDSKAGRPSRLVIRPQIQVDWPAKLQSG
jgi:hypothetical protein